MICPHCGQPMPEDMSDPEAAEAKLRRDAHDTERLAYLAVLPRAGTQRLRVLDFLATRWPDGATDEEIEKSLVMRPSTQRPRRVELVEGGWAKETSERRPTTSGQLAIVWKLTHRAAVHFGLRRPVRHR